MATIVITDETALAQAIAINLLRQFAVGTGAGTDRATVYGVSVATGGAVADASTVNSTSVAPVFGSSTIAGNSGSVTITTPVAGRKPVAVVTHSAQARDVEKWDAVHCTDQPPGIPRFEIATLSNGSFAIVNNDHFVGCTVSSSTAAYGYM